MGACDGVCCSISLGITCTVQLMLKEREADDQSESKIVLELWLLSNYFPICRYRQGESQIQHPSHNFPSKLDCCMLPANYFSLPAEFT